MSLVADFPYLRSTTYQEFKKCRLCEMTSLILIKLTINWALFAVSACALLRISFHSP